MSKIFNSYIRNKQTFNSETSTSKHTFNSYIRNNHTFGSVIDGLQVSLSWVIKLIINSPAIITRMSLLTNYNIKVITPTINLITSALVAKLNQAFSISLDTKKPTLIIRMSMAQSMGNTVIRIPIKTEFILNILSKMSFIQVSIPSVRLSITPVAKKYYLVSDWDSSLLSTLDTMNLVDMEYQIV